MKKFIYQLNNWPNFHWNFDDISHLLAYVRNQQGRLVGKMETLGFQFQNEAVLETLTIDILKSTEIEGITFNKNDVKSSVASRLGINIAGLPSSNKNIEGVVDMMFDATKNFNKPLTKSRLFKWHRSLFPAGGNDLNKISVGKWRNDSNGPMQVISGPTGKEKVHFQAPPASSIENEMKSFLLWLNKNDRIDLVLKAAVAHLRFLTIHPFDDGNGRIARAITDMFLAKSDGLAQRYYSMSAQIQRTRKKYYDALEKSQNGKLDITHWIVWFLTTLSDAITNSEKVIAKVINKNNFWNSVANKIDNNRQKLLLNKLLNGFNGKLTSSKWAKIAKCSHDTALRDIQLLIDKKILIKSQEGGRSTSYLLNYKI